MSKKKIILTCKHGRPSTRLVYGTMNSGTLVQRRQVIRKKNGVRSVRNEYYRTFINNDSETMIKQTDVDFTGAILVRWGSQEVIETDSSNIVYNQSKALKIATNKKQSREVFIEQGVSTPALVTPVNFNEEWLPIIARPLNHSKGKNFVVLSNRTQFLNHYNTKHAGWYYSQFINKEREFRIHCGHNKALVVMEKVKPSDDNIAWNRAQNDTDPFEYITWTQVDEQKLKPVIEEALKATQAVGLDMSGVDVMLFEDQAFVLEVNTAPTLNTSPYVAERWGKYLDWLFREDTRREHWDTTEFKKGSSFIWKNYQLEDRKKD